MSSSAKGVNTVPLCVLAIAPAVSDTIHVTGTSQLQAGQCMVHSNQALVSDAGASILASANEAGTTATGTITQAANLQAPNIADPFASLNVNPVCSTNGQAQNLTGTTSLSPGTFTGPIGITGDATVTLAPGEYYFCKTLTISGNSTLTGTNVVLVFENGAVLAASGAKTSISLSGRQDGPLAGFVLIADRSYTSSFTLPSDNITTLTGTVYAPTATLVVQGGARSGASSPWTVIAAKGLTVNGGAQLIVNSDYTASNVPVPTGVGNQRHNVQLTP